MPEATTASYRRNQIWIQWIALFFGSFVVKTQLSGIRFEPNQAPVDWIAMAAGGLALAGSLGIRIILIPRCQTINNTCYLALFGMALALLVNFIGLFMVSSENPMTSNLFFGISVLTHLLYVPIYTANRT